jgi:hypothetical protein
MPLMQDDVVAYVAQSFSIGNSPSLHPIKGLENLVDEETVTVTLPRSVDGDARFFDSFGHILVVTNGSTIHDTLTMQTDAPSGANYPILNRVARFLTMNVL